MSEKSQEPLLPYELMAENDIDPNSIEYKLLAQKRANDFSKKFNEEIE